MLKFFFENLMAANPACEMFYNTSELVALELRRLGVIT
jgi:hypothetical protein